jgi:hypothetical protein
MMKLSIKKKETACCLLLFLAVMAIFHSLMREYIGDFIKFSSYLNHRTLPQLLLYRYQTWSSQVLIEAPLMLMSHYHLLLLWKILDTLMWAAALAVMMRLTRHKADKLVTCLFLLYPILEMGSAGWVATTMNYLWPATACMAALISLDKLYQGEKVGFFPAIGFLLLELYGTNFETLGAFYFCVLFYFSICAILYKKKRSIGSILFVLLQYAISIGNMAFALTCPGNDLRKAQEIHDWMRDFVSLTKVDKLVLGTDVTGSALLSSNLFFAAFSLMLFLAILLRKNHTKAHLALSAIPGIFVLARTILNPVIAIYFPAFGKMFGSSVGRIDGIDYYNPSSYLPFILFILIAVSIFLAFMNGFETLHQGVFLCVVFLAGLLTRVVMGFSPTLYGSGNRTFFFLDLAMVFCITKMYCWRREEIRASQRSAAILKGSLYAVTALAVVANMASICVQY